MFLLFFYISILASTAFGSQEAPLFQNVYFTFNLDSHHFENLLSNLMYSVCFVCKYRWAGEGDVVA